MLVEFEEGDGDLAGVALKETLKGSGKWRAMQQSWGAVWKLDAGYELKPPFSIQLTSQYSGQTLVAKNVIPDGWKPGSTYRSLVNYLWALAQASCDAQLVLPISVLYNDICFIGDCLGF